MKKYYIDNYIRYWYPRCPRECLTKNYGVLSEYIGSRYTGKRFTRNEIDRIICEMFVRHPYIDNAMQIEIDVKYQTAKEVGTYYSFTFPNDSYAWQRKGSSEIKYKNNKKVTI